jgi:hypothetical protein
LKLHERQQEAFVVLLKLIPISFADESSSTLIIIEKICKQKQENSKIKE